MNKLTCNDLSFLRQIKFRPHPAERGERLTDGAGGSTLEHALASLQ